MNVSVIIPTRNPNKMKLGRAVGAALSLGCEVVVWFDHTDDEWHRDWVGCGADYQLRGAKVGYGRVGQVGAMNGALAMVTREYVIFHGDDDWLGIGIKDLAGYLDNNPSVAFAYGAMQYVGDCDDYRVAVQYTDESIYASNQIGTGAIVRTDLLRALGGWECVHDLGWDVPHAEDYDLWLRLHEMGYIGRAVASRAVVQYTLDWGGRGTSRLRDNVDVVHRAFVAKHPKYKGRLV